MTRPPLPQVISHYPRWVRSSIERTAVGGSGSTVRYGNRGAERQSGSQAILCGGQGGDGAVQPKLQPCRIIWSRTVQMERLILENKSSDHPEYANAKKAAAPPEAQLLPNYK